MVDLAACSGIIARCSVVCSAGLRAMLVLEIAGFNKWFKEVCAGYRYRKFYPLMDKA